MASVTIDNKLLIKDYLNALNGRPKTEDRVNQYVSDPGLKERIRRRKQPSRAMSWPDALLPHQRRPHRGALDAMEHASAVGSINSLAGI
jgi:hypothetical protein